MEILPVLNSYFNDNKLLSSVGNQLNPAFCSSSRVIFNKNRQLVCNYTKFVREDLDWKKFAMLLYEKYKAVNKVNILNFACSDGSESLTLMAALSYYLDNEADKFFPIRASDVDETIISEAKSGLYQVNNKDLSRLNVLLNNYSDYFTLSNNSRINFPYNISPLKKYAGNVIFEQISMLDAIKYIEPENNVILCRNALPYLKNNKEQEFVDKLAEVLDASSLLVIGCYDNGHGIDALLKLKGFKPYELENVYCKY